MFSLQVRKVLHSFPTFHCYGVQRCSQGGEHVAPQPAWLLSAFQCPLFCHLLKPRQGKGRKWRKVEVSQFSFLKATIKVYGSLSQKQEAWNQPTGSVLSLISPHIPPNWRGKMETVTTLFSWTPLQMVTAAMKLKDTCCLDEKLWQT